MPLTRHVTFRVILEKGNRVQIPKIIRWQFKLEPDQVLKVGFSVPDNFLGWQFFYAKNGKLWKNIHSKSNIITLAATKKQLTRLHRRNNT